MVAQRTIRVRTIVLVCVALLGLAALLAVLILVHPRHRHVASKPALPTPTVPAARGPTAQPGLAGAIAAAHGFAAGFSLGRRAYGYRVLSFHPRKGLIEFIAPENLDGSIRWWVIDVPVVRGAQWRVNAPWMTLDAAGSPPPPLDAYKPWPS